MLKEIEEQPDAIAETIGERLYHGELQLDGLELSDEQIRDLSRVVFLACGTSYHAGLVGRYLLEEWARVPSESDIASEWRYRHAVIDERTLVIAVAQSGETTDTLAAMKEARGARRPRPRGHERDGLADDARVRLGPLHARGARDRRRGHQDVHGAGDAHDLLALKLGLIRGTIDATRAEHAARSRCATCPTWRGGRSTGASSSSRSPTATTRTSSSSTSAATWASRSRSRARSS